MYQESIISNLNELPDFYKQEVLDYSDFLISKVKKNGNNKNKSRGGFGARKGDYIMSDDFDEPLEDFKEYMP